MAVQSELVGERYGRNAVSPGEEMDTSSSGIVLPHWNYDVLSAEPRAENHTEYLGSDAEQWNGTMVLEESKFIHFLDWPVPKP